MQDEMLAVQIQLKRSEIPKNWSVDAADFINKVFYLFMISI
jgi:hypothetical protein